MKSFIFGRILNYLIRLISNPIKSYITCSNCFTIKPPKECVIKKIGRSPTLASFNFLREIKARSWIGKASPFHFEIGKSYPIEIILAFLNSSGSQSLGQITKKKMINQY